MENIIALKDLRLNMNKYVQDVKSGQSFVVVKQSKPIFRISPLDDDGRWEEVADFTKVKKGGVDIDDILTRL
ncbi:type II toxin-antitoxin system prevent-host-death family antitoxin [Patescibacteria group bacterium]|nr:type II toxin-antitoxin system prevent-host-death family antitoxin [Patescibacteria group bacterium]